MALLQESCAAEPFPLVAVIFHRGRLGDDAGAGAPKRILRNHLSAMVTAPI